MLKGRDEQALAEPSGAAQEVDLSRCDYLIDQVGLIYIHISFFADTLKALDADGIFHSAVSFLC